MTSQKVRPAIIQNNSNLQNELLRHLGHDLLDKWYPLCIDKKNGGYYTNISYNWNIEPVQHKMIVTQARHVWAASKAAILLDNKIYAEAAIHGFDFLKNSMWDKKYGGFFQMRDFKGEYTDYLGFCDEKRTYGNTFAIYGLSALYELTGDKKVLDFAQEAFRWIELHAFDHKLNGYFEFLTREGKTFDKNGKYSTRADDGIEVGYKDQNSSIHLIEAYTELYSVWPDEELRKKLYNLLILIRDVITTTKGYMNLFFEYDWTPVSFKDAIKEIREKNYRLDHVSFGHDYETAFLMLEASHTLGLETDIETLTVAKKMVDHAIVNGWDDENGGFFDAGYYFSEENSCKIIQSTKNWWAQAEGLNVLLIMSEIFPDEQIYKDYFKRQLHYIKNYLLDEENGGWFEGGLDKEPHFKTGPKGHIWKGSYHTGRALMNCVKILADKNFPLMKNKNFRHEKEKFDEFINHWKKNAESLAIKKTTRL
ncbi:MAG: AGE family epimerase/isomerase [Ignavibacteriaceae bacterium]